MRLLVADAGESARHCQFRCLARRHEQADVYIGRYLNVLVRGPSSLIFRARRAVLDREILRPHGKLSVII